MIWNGAATHTPVRSPRLQGALFQPIVDGGRAELVERRIADAIMGGHLRAGERLPSETDLAHSLGVAPVTVREALVVLRARGLIVTRRGRNGGSFVTEDADPVAFARIALRESSRLKLRDLGAHYAAITGTAVRLAARRATPAEVQALRARLDRADAEDPVHWRATLDDVQVELVALSQSARLTREQMRLQAELSPLLRLVDGDPADRTALCGRLRAMLDAVEAGDERRAGDESDAFVTEAITRLISVQAADRRTTSPRESQGGDHG